MTTKKWLNLLKKNIKNTTYGEKQSLVWYYEELINDKIENGENEEAVLKNLGNPFEVAKQISDDAVEKQKNEIPTKKELPLWTNIILWFFIITVGFPLFISWIAIIFSFGAIAVSGFAITLAGIISIIASIFMAIFGVVQAKFALIGCAIMLTGVGLIVISLFYYASKGMIFLTGSFFKKFFKGEKEL